MPWIVWFFANECLAEFASTVSLRSEERFDALNSLYSLGTVPWLFPNLLLRLVDILSNSDLFKAVGSCSHSCKDQS